MIPEICKQCGSEDFSYIGLDDGGGPYGDSVVQEWRCMECGYVVEQVVDFADLDYDDPHTDPFDEKRA